MRDADKYRGCLVGGAAGDALGYAVELMGEGEVFSRYGRAGIRGCELDRSGMARFSDDTQMTLFTANIPSYYRGRGTRRQSFHPASKTSRVR